MKNKVRELIYVILFSAWGGIIVGGIQLSAAWIKRGGFFAVFMGPMHAILAPFVSVPIGVTLYYLVLERDIREAQYIQAIIICSVVGAISGLLIDLSSLVLTPITLIGLAFYYRHENKKRRTAEQQ